MSIFYPVVFKRRDLFSPIKQVQFFLLMVMLSISASVIASNHPPVHKEHAVDHGVIVVSGSGKVEVTPDEIRFVVGIDAKAPTVQQAYQDVDNKMRQAMEIFRDLNIAKKDIQAMHLNVNPIIDYKQRDRIIAHDARRDIAVKLTDIDVYAKVMQRLADIEIMRFQQVQLSSSKRASLEIQALERAYENAEQKAVKLASKAGRKLGKVIEVIEMGAQRSPQPKLMRSHAVAMAADGQESGAIVSAGIIVVRANISASFLVGE